MIGECIGYDRDDSDLRYYKVIGTDDFIAEFLNSGEMDEFFFYIVRLHI